MKIYTKRGDEGETSLLGGDRVSKADLRVCAYGDVDELNATLGLARAVVTDQELETILERLQNECFDLGAELAAAKPKPDLQRVSDESIQAMETEIDRFTDELPALKNFILPGGGISAATLHHARAVSRRAERSMVTLNDAAPIRPELLRYVNRLSDLLFTMARLANHRAGLPETQWKK